MEKLKNSFTGKNVEYYDMYFLPKEKLKNECKYVMNICTSYLPNFDNLIDVGCGTGAHAQLFSENFKNVYGIDISDDMIKYAREKHSEENVQFFCLDIRNIERKIAEDCSLVLSLAHVIGYQLDNISVKKFLLGINRILKDGGIFLFNFYYQPALYLNNLEPRSIKIEGKKETITRISNACLSPNENCINLDYYYIVENESNVLHSYEVHEKMRFFSYLEMEYFLFENGFEVLDSFEYNTSKGLSSKTWNVGILAKKISSR